MSVCLPESLVDASKTCSSQWPWLLPSLHTTDGGVCWLHGWLLGGWVKSPNAWGLDSNTRNCTSSEVLALFFVSLCMLPKKLTIVWNISVKTEFDLWLPIQSGWNLICGYRFSQGKNLICVYRFSQGEIWFLFTDSVRIKLVIRSLIQCTLTYNYIVTLWRCHCDPIIMTTGSTVDWPCSWYRWAVRNRNMTTWYPHFYVSVKDVTLW